MILKLVNELTKETLYQEFEGTIKKESFSQNDLLVAIGSIGGQAEYEEVRSRYDFNIEESVCFGYQFNWENEGFIHKGIQFADKEGNKKFIAFTAKSTCYICSSEGKTVDKIKF